MVPFGSMSIKRRLGALRGTQGFPVGTWAAVLCGYLALGATIQALPGLELGSPATTGALVTLAAAATAIARPFAGRWADRGAPVARVGAALVALGAAGHLTARTVPEMAAARLVLGAGEGALFTGALVAGVHGPPGGRPGGPVRALRVAAVGGVRPDGRGGRGGRLMGHWGLWMGGGLALGRVLGAALGGRALWFAAAVALASLAWARGRAGARARAPGRSRLLPPVALRL